MEMAKAIEVGVEEHKGGLNLGKTNWELTPRTHQPSFSTLGLDDLLRFDSPEDMALHANSHAKLLENNRPWCFATFTIKVAGHCDTMGIALTLASFRNCRTKAKRKSAPEKPKNRANREERCTPGFELRSTRNFASKSKASALDSSSIRTRHDTPERRTVQGTASAGLARNLGHGEGMVVTVIELAKPSHADDVERATHALKPVSTARK